MEASKMKILIFGGTGYLGKYMVKASVSMAHPTYVYVRPITPNSHPSKLHLNNQFQAMGVTILQGELDEHEKLVSVFREVDVVISTLAVPQHLEQLKLIRAMREAGNIKRFVPSEFGNEVDRVGGTLPPFQALLDNKKKIRRATEEAAIPYTYVSANSFAAYFVDYLLHPRQNLQHVTVYGSGKAKAVLNLEEDIAAYTVRAATDERVANRVIIYRPPGNIVSQLDLISMWEEKTGRSFKITHVPVSILHNIFIKGEQTGFELREEDLEASQLYPDYNYTSVDAFLDICLLAPPNPKLAAFA